ncbi:MAG TPA: threonine synthase [Chloroflexota bacterium]|nr:threonine synthase [Chloroflexota bacterium]
MNGFLDHLECSACAATYDADQLHTVCPSCGKVLIAKYDLKKVRDAVRPDDFTRRSGSLWRYREVLPVRNPENVVTLGEGWTPLLDAPRLGASLGCRRILLKDEGINPTGSFKARGLTVAVSRAKELGARRLGTPSAGNAACAMSAYAARAGLPAYVFMPRDAPVMNQAECVAYGAHLFLVDGLISDCGRIVRREGGERGWFDVSTLREPYRAEGKKTMGYEIAEQLGWRLPDVIVYPTGGGTGIVGMWKAFAEMEELGWISAKRPRMISVQAAGCAPIVRAFEQNLNHAEAWAGAQTIAGGLRVPAAIGDYLILDAIRESGGTALAVDDDQIVAAMRELAALEGVFVSTEAGATLAGLRQLLVTQQVDPDAEIVLFLTGSGLLSADAITVDRPVLDPDDVEGCHRAIDLAIEA